MQQILTGVPSFIHPSPMACQRCRLLVQARGGMRENGASAVKLRDLW
ncbi:hypothetical protein IGS61_09650 [Janthinobacterium sp. FW305-129]|nr:hypothetical protein [Janthinobacterium sp. FW305-129]MCC7597750.1 hypothetical protein [Janthinobacterium sp. FW305-129]